MLYYCPSCGWSGDLDPDTQFIDKCEACETKLAIDRTPTLRKLGQNPFFIPKEKLTPLGSEWSKPSPEAYKCGAD